MGMARALEVAEEPQIKLLISGSPFSPSPSSDPPHPSSSSSSSSFMASSANHLHQHQKQQQTHHLDFHQMHNQQQSNQISFGGGMIPSSSLNPTSSVNPYISRDGGGGGGGGGYDLGELEQALFLYLDGQAPSDNHHHPHHNGHNPNPSSAEDQRQDSGMRPPTLNIFPSQPMHVDPSTKACGGVGGGLSQSTTTCTTGPNRPSEPSMELSTDPKVNGNASAPSSDPSKSLIKRQGNRRGGLASNSDGEGPKTPDPKTLRRLAQNREAARKSRLRKKAYVQQLESSRIRLSQIEQELQRARAQGIFFGGGSGGGEQGIPSGVTNISSDAAVFDLEYTRWLEEHHKITCELRAAVQEHLPENELKMYVDNYLAHYDVAMSLKGVIARNDAFHLVSGMWMTPAERCFMWIGGFRPSEVIKIVMHQIEPLTEQQLLGICQLQQSTHEAEEGLSQGLESLNQSISDTIASDALSWPPNMPNYMGQMAVAMNKLSTLEGFLRQADGLRYQTFHRLHQLLTTRQAARCFLGIAEYFHRLRALSSLWVARPRQDQ